VLLTVKAGGQSAGKGGGNEAPQQAGAGRCELEARLPPPRLINVAMEDMTASRLRRRVATRVVG
jgi:hypothetical protein